MRKIDFDKPFGEDDVAWLRQAGFLSEELIERHQARFDAGVPEIEIKPDTVTQSALDPSARGRGEPVPGDSHPVNVTPEAPKAGDAVDDGDEDADDYDSWKIGELRDEVEARNEIAKNREGVTRVEPVGTGKDGAVVKADVIKALRVWDAENPGVLDA